MSLILPSVATELTLRHGNQAANVVTATSTDLSYIIDRAKLHVNAQGFVPRSNLVEHVRRGQVWIVTIGGQPAGYVWASGGLRSPMVLRHNTVERELWEHGLGSAFVAWLADFAAAATPFEALYIRTRRDLVRQISINQSVGGVIVGTAEHVGCRGHAVDVWRVPLLGRPIA